MAEAIIEVDSLTKVFRMGKEQVHALRGIELEVRRGEYLSLMGPSGSGKSTLFNMIGGLDRPTSGNVTIGGIRLNRLKRAELAYFRGNHIGYIFQAYNLIAHLSAIDNVAVPLLFSGLSDGEARDRAREVLCRVGLEHRLENRPDELSGGQQQRVAIARALANRPLIILADEPTANLDLKTGEDIIALLAELCREDGVTVVSATHDHKMLAASDRILWIKDGQVEKIQTAAEANIRVGAVTPNVSGGGGKKGDVE